MRKMLIDGYKLFVKRGLWALDDISYLLASGRITQDEFNDISGGLSSLRTSTVKKGLEHTYEIWDKVSPINGVAAEEIIKSSGFREGEEIVKISLGNRVVELSEIETLRANHRISLDATAEQVAEEHLAVMAEIQNTPPINVEELNTAAMIMHNYQLEDKLALILDAVNEIKTGMRGDVNQGDI